MRNLFTLALLVASVGVASMGTIGCGDGGSGGSGGGDGGSGGSGGSGGDGGSGAATTGTTGGTTGTTGGTTSSTGNLDCTGQLDGSDCGNCVEGNCCLELTACAEDAECFDCLSNPDADPNVCNTNAQLGAINECAGALCPDECGGGGGAEPSCDAPATSPSMGSCVTIAGGNECNPITNEGCTDPGAACDASEAGFTCYPDGNVQALCDECGVTGSDYCMAGMTCVGKCARYCCEDTDCGTGKCTKGVFADAAVGFCEAL